MDVHEDAGQVRGKGHLQTGEFRANQSNQPVGRDFRHHDDHKAGGQRLVQVPCSSIALKQLGLDPLVTLLALYAGFKLFKKVGLGAEKLNGHGLFTFVNVSQGGCS